MKYHKQLLAVTYMLLAFAANPQKLPSIQQTSLRAPANFKIDGKALELNDTFQAYNHSCDIYYTICNDDDNLYLIIKATYPQVINKIVNSLTLKRRKCYS